jgi:cytochrome c-type biogenesis protein CcmH/NrfF
MNLYQRQPEEMSPESLRGIQPSELGNVELNTEQTKAQALQSAMSELEEELKKRLHNGCSSIVEETRSRLRKELSAALEAFGEDASARLRALQQEQVAESKSKIQLQMAERVREQVNEIQTALNKPCAELKTLAAQAESAVTSMASAVDAAAKKLQTAEQKLEGSFSSVVNELGKVADNLLRSSASQLEKQADETALRFSASLRTTEAKLIEEINSHIAPLKQTLLESLTRESKIIVEESRRQLRQKPEEHTPPGGRQSEVLDRNLFEDQQSFRNPANQPKMSTERPGRPKGSDRHSPTSPANASHPVVLVDEAEKPYTQILGEMAAARHTGGRPVRGTAPRSSWRTVAIWAGLVIPLIAIFLGSYYYFLRQEHARDLVAPRQPQSRVQGQSHGTSGVMPSEKANASVAPPASLKPNSSNPTSSSTQAHAPETASLAPEGMKTDETALDSVSPTKDVSKPPIVTPARPGEQAGVAGGRGDLTVTSEMPGARISLDGHTDPTWITPHTFTNLPAHLYMIAVSKDGYEPAAQSVRVGPGLHPSFHARLAFATGEITVVTVPPGLEVYVDGKPYGLSPTRAVLPIGQHTYKVTPPPGKAPLSKSFLLRASGDMLKHTVSW